MEVRSVGSIESLGSGSRCFRVDVVHTGGHAVLQLHGDLDMGTVEVFAEAVRGVQAQGIQELVLDLSTLDFIDSRGLCEFVVAANANRRSAAT